MTTETIVGTGTNVYSYDDNNQLAGWKDIAGTDTALLNVFAGQRVFRLSMN